MCGGCSRSLERQGRHAPAAVAGQCTPALDVLETDEAIEIVMDLPGVDAATPFACC